ncbi:MAG: hypothetical protein WC734_04760 [Patescibacteria group bacterium]|jgi:hypothetical protein
MKSIIQKHYCRIVIPVMVVAGLVCLLNIQPMSVQADGLPVINTVSGSFEIGQSATITGSGFGTRGDFNNLNDSWQGIRFLNFRFKDFEDSGIESDGFTTWYDDSRDVITVGGHTGSYGHFYYGTTQEIISLNAQNTDLINGTYYASFWFMVPENQQSGKFFRLWFSNNSIDTLSFYTGCSDNYLRAGNGCSQNTQDIQYTSPDQFQPNVWHRVDILVHSAIDDLDVKTWMDGVLQWEKADWCTSWVGNYSPGPSDYGWNIANFIDKPGELDPGLYRCAAHPTWDGSYNYDDIYFDYTQARVEIGNTSTWDTNTHREIQIPHTTWNDDQIQFTVNQGTFTNGESAYLYVVDENGVVNTTGYPITFAGANDCTPSWDCSDWSVCADSIQTRSCHDDNNCGTDAGRPVESAECDSTAPAVVMDLR